MCKFKYNKIFIYKRAKIYAMYIGMILALFVWQYYNIITFILQIRFYIEK